MIINWFIHKKHKKIQVEDFLKTKATEKFKKLLSDSNVNENELEQLCSKIAQFCTKEAIGVKIFNFFSVKLKTFNFLKFNK